MLSWLLLRGRCAGCTRRISPRYPIVELVTGGLFVAVAARFGVSPQLPAYLYLAAVAVALAVIDLDTWRLPDAVVRPSYVVGAGLLVVPAAVAGDWATAGRSVLAMLALYGLYLGLSFIQPGAMGFGDVKLAGLLGLFLGWLGWGQVLVGTGTGFLLGGLVGAALLATRRAGRKSAIPFGPAMLTGALFAVFFADPVAQWYTATFLSPA